MIPINQPQFLEFAAIVANGDDIRLQLLGKDIIGDTLWMRGDQLKQGKDLFIVIFVEIQA